MRNIILPLPEEMHHREKFSRKIYFEMSRDKYWLNNKEYDVKKRIDIDFTHYQHTIMKDTVLVTLFSEDSIF